MTGPATPELDAVLRRIDDDLESAIGRWSDLLRIPSVSTDSRHDADIQAAAAWLESELAALGFQVEIRETEGHPVVLAHHSGAGGDAPHVLYYGHYDVQPPDPVELWDSEPFEPTIVEGPLGRRMVARGAVDDKGQLLTWLEALRAWLQVHGSLPVRVTVLIEGEEEIGSRNLRPFLESARHELQADVCVVSDTAMWDATTPAITSGLRGLLYTEVTCHGPTMDLHSGFYGGVVQNPLTALTSVLGQLHDEAGRITIPGFYEDVVEPDASVLAGWETLGFDESAFLRGVGVDAGRGESGYSALERLWARPACDINGLHGGYTGEGAKTVIPTQGAAKVSFRLVPDQDPDRIATAFAGWLEQRTPPGCRIELDIHSSARGIRVETDSPWMRAARAALAATFEREPVLIGCGGSIPIVGWMREMLAMDTLLIGFGLEDDRMHSPNEKFEVCCFSNGMRAHAALLDQLRQSGGRSS